MIEASRHLHVEDSKHLHIVVYAKDSLGVVEFGTVRMVIAGREFTGVSRGSVLISPLGRVDDDFDIQVGGGDRQVSLTYRTARIDGIFQGVEFVLTENEFHLDERVFPLDQDRHITIFLNEASDFVAAIEVPSSDGGVSR